ncbi:MAG: orotidine-5'-phosphate decarboxylase [Bacteroidales bacterium]|nr:orotidine-5'-phosphate decarboxylase [Bacteroidales bacterium]
MTRQELNQEINRKRSCLCIGLDAAPVSFEMNKKIIDETANYAVAFKPNVAFYEADGWKGWKILEKTMDYLRSTYPGHFLIADAKRGDIGNTAKEYARTFFERMDFDAITLSPYMGYDSIEPFLEYTQKWVIILALTSNPSATDFQLFSGAENKPLYRHVIDTANTWADNNKIMYVAGATRPHLLQEVRKAAPDRFLLVPGVGAQGGAIEEVMQYGKTQDGDLLINVSRSVIYSDKGFAQAAGLLADSMSRFFS